MSNALPMIASVASLALGVNASAALAADAAKVKSVVLVHGGFVDGSGWEGVYDLLKKDGYDVTIVQNPTTSLADDVAVTKRAIAAAPGKVILVGHSYGGVVASEAGTDPKVAGIVYIAAFAPDAGESAASLIANPPPGAPVPPILPPVDGFLLLDKAKFAASFAADVRPDLASFMAASQVPWGVGALDGKVTGLEGQAQLVPCHHRRQDDPSGGSAENGEPGRSDHRRDAGQPRRLRLEPRCCRQSHPTGGRQRPYRLSRHHPVSDCLGATW
jgi:pimeloyl-ACP methyl ester carboxylesterase